MGLIVDRFHPLDGEVRVALRGPQRFVAQDFLDGPEIGPVVEQVGRHRVAQHMRMSAANVRGGFEGIRDDMVDHSWSEPLAVFEEEKRLGCPHPALSRWERVSCKINFNGFGGFRSDGDNALLAAFAENANGARLEIEFAEIDGAEFRAAESAGIEKFDDRAISRG